MPATPTLLPDFLGARLSEQYERADVERILAGCNVERNVTLRANTLRASRSDVAHALDDAGIAWSSVSWYPDAFVIRKAREDAIRALGAYQRGELYLQSLSSMIPPLALDAKPGQDICDLCAAPGGKTTQIAALTEGKALITACELHAPRAEKLRYNLEKLGAGNVTVMRTDARNLDTFFSFDRILLDAPCSGSGTLSTANPKQLARFTPKLVEKSVRTQRALLSRALMLLKPGGVLVYSTCSVLAEENETIVESCLSRAQGRTFEIAPLDIGGLDADARLPSRLEGALCLCPSELFEGFFIAKIKRTS